MHNANKHPRTLLAILLVGHLTGCTGVSFQSPAAAESGGGGPVAQAYASWTHESCAPNDWCGVKLASAAGIHPDGQRGGALINPKRSMANPDPEWLPGWAQLPESDDDARDFFEALSLAATRKSWSNACRERYAAVKRQLDERVAKTKDAVAAARSLEDRHARLQTLLAVPARPAVTPAIDTFGEGFDAAAFEAERAIAEELRAQDKLWLLQFEPIRLPESAREVLAPRWPSKLEETAFCMRAADRGHGTLPPLREPGESTLEPIRELVKPVFSEEQRRAVEAEREKRSAIAEDALGYATGKPKERIEQLSTAASDKIIGFDVRGGRAVIKLHTRREYNRSIGDLCSNSRNRIGACPSMRVIKEEHRTIEFSSWPDGLSLEEGDVITFFGIVDESSITGSGTPVEKRIDRIRGLHVRSVTKQNGTEHQYLVAQR